MLVIPAMGASTTGVSTVMRPMVRERRAGAAPAGGSEGESRTVIVLRFSHPAAGGAR